MAKQRKLPFDPWFAPAGNGRCQIQGSVFGPVAEDYEIPGVNAPDDDLGREIYRAQQFFRTRIIWMWTLGKQTPKIHLVRLAWGFAPTEDKAKLELMLHVHRILRGDESPPDFASFERP